MNKAGDSFRCVYHFDLSSIPGGSTIDSATAWFYVTGADSGGPVEVYRITASWASCCVNWTNTGSAYDSATVHGTFSPSATGWVSVDLTSLVQGWVDGTWPNHGVMFISTSTDTESKYTSKEWSTASERPCMEVLWSTATVVNYRSIGTNTGTVYSTGNATVATGSTTVTFGSGASLPANVGQGDKLTTAGDTYYILSKDSATQVTVHSPSASPHTTTAYTITRVYNTLQAWEDDRQGDLVADNRREIGVAYNDGPFSTVLSIAGSTTDANHYMTLTVAESQRHDGTAGTGVVLDMGGASANIPIQIWDAYTKFEWFEVTDSKQGRRHGQDGGDGLRAVELNRARRDQMGHHGLEFRHDDRAQLRGVRRGGGWHLHLSGHDHRRELHGRRDELARGDLLPQLRPNGRDDQEHDLGRQRR